MVGLFAQLLILGLTPVQAQAYVTLEQMGRAAEYQCADEIIMAESSWRPHVRGDNGDSYGLAQRHAPSHGVPPQPVVRPRPDRVVHQLRGRTVWRVV
jgi:hypothetical protein